MKLAICTPFYEIKGYSPYITSLMQSVQVLHALGIEFEYYEISGDSYVDRAKNTLAHRFMESDATHLFMIDSDMAWTATGFAKMIKNALHGFEVIAAAYPCKNVWEFFGCIPKLDEKGFHLGKEVNDIRVLDMLGVPGGFIIYSREAFERTKPNISTYTDLKHGITYHEYFKCNIERDKPKTLEELQAMTHEELATLAMALQGPKLGGHRIGEDIYFQQRYREMGGRVWMEPDITISHYGVKGWVGNYHEYILNNKGSQEIE
jgi:hypothetical protein